MAAGSRSASCGTIASSRYFLVWRDLKVRYKQTALGIGWAVVQPLVTVVIFRVIFGRLADLPSDGVPYPVFTLAALLPWQLFSAAFTGRRRRRWSAARAW